MSGCEHSQTQAAMRGASSPALSGWAGATHAGQSFRRLSVHVSNAQLFCEKQTAMAMCGTQHSALMSWRVQRALLSGRSRPGLQLELLERSCEDLRERGRARLLRCGSRGYSAVLKSW